MGRVASAISFFVQYSELRFSDYKTNVFVCMSDRSRLRNKFHTDKFCRLLTLFLIYSYFSVSWNFFRLYQKTAPLSAFAELVGHSWEVVAVLDHSIKAYQLETSRGSLNLLRLQPRKPYPVQTP